MTGRIVTLALALVLAPASLGAQQSPEARIDAAKRRAQDAGVPAALLENRVAEGRAKGVPMDRIAAAVERRAASLVRAGEVLRGAPGVTEADLSAGADAVEAGIGEEPLRQVIARARTGDRPVAIAVLTYLHRERGLPVGQALARVSTALEAGPEALRELPAQARGNGPDPARGGGRPAGVGGGRPDGAGGPPATVPAPGDRPGGGKPPGVGNRPDNPGRPGRGP